MLDGGHRGEQRDDEREIPEVRLKLSTCFDLHSLEGSGVFQLAHKSEKTFFVLFFFIKVFPMS